MIDLSNPAARLEHWLQLANSKVPKTDQGKAKVHAHTTFGEVWGLDHETLTGQAELLHRGASMIALGGEVRARVEVADPVMGPAALEHYGEVEATLQRFMKPTLRLHEFLAPMTSLGWYSLSLCSRILTIGVTPQLLAEESHEDLLRQVRHLLDQVAAAGDLDEVDKTDLTARLREVELLLARVGVTGQETAQAAVDGLIGCVVRLAGRGSSVINHPVAQGVFGLINAIMAVTGLGADVAALAEGGLATLRQLGPE